MSIPISQFITPQPPPPVAALSSVAPKLPASTTRSLRPRRGFLVCGKLSSFTAPSHWCRCCPYSFVSVISFFFCPTQVRGGVSCLLGGLRSSASVQRVFCRSSSTCRCISDVFVGRKVISMSYSPAILKVSPLHYFLLQNSFLLYGSTTLYLSILQLRDIWLISTSWLLWIT